jgi:hypothetical protein
LSGRYFRWYRQSLRQHLHQAQTSRVQWRLLKQFPQCFVGVQSEDALTETQWLWLQCQYLLDDGAQLCPACEALGYGVHCQACGVRVQPESHECDHCHLAGTGAYCQHCGAVLHSPIAEAIEMGTFDWETWERSLQPFLGDMTPQEQALLAQG